MYEFPNSIPHVQIPKLAQCPRVSNQANDCSQYLLYVDHYPIHTHTYPYITHTQKHPITPISQKLPNAPGFINAQIRPHTYHGLSPHLIREFLHQAGIRHLQINHNAILPFMVLKHTTAQIQSNEAAFSRIQMQNI